MGSLWQYSNIHNSACKIIEEQTLGLGADSVPCLVAEPGHGG